MTRNGKAGFQRTALFRTDGVNEMFGIWETCMNTCRSGNMHNKQKQEMKKGRKVGKWKEDLERKGLDIKRWANRMHISKLVFTYDSFASSNFCASVFHQMICLLCTLHNVCAWARTV
jgi:hypothetical protein